MVKTENKINIEDLVMELNGRIMPVGSSEVDSERFENLQRLCESLEGLIMRVKSIVDENKDRHEWSVKNHVQYANEFLQKVGIKKRPIDVSDLPGTGEMMDGDY